MSDVLIFYVNGKRVEDGNADPETTLLTYLRLKLRLTGTKLGCGEGGCGACTVMVSKLDKKSNKIRHLSVNACLAPVVSMHECAVTTIEGIGGTKTKLHAVQERLARYHGSQCGFCTPGIVMSMYTLLRNNPEPTKTEIDDYMQGNLCRCTGYRPIIAAFETFTKSTVTKGCGLGAQCCQVQRNGISNGQDVIGEYANGDEYTSSRDPTQELIFPTQLLKMSTSSANGMKFIGERSTWYVPVHFHEFLFLRHKYPHARVIGGNTEVGIETQIKGSHYTEFLSPVHIKEMNSIEVTSEGLTIGAACTLTELNEAIYRLLPNHAKSEVQVMKALVDMLHWFAGTQIRNVSAIGGNIMTSSPISDINPILAASGSKLVFSRLLGGQIVTRLVEVNSDFFTGYRKTATEQEEILTKIILPFSRKNEVFCAYKQAKRREDDISIVNAAFLVRFRTSDDTVEYFSSAFGGMAPTTVQSKGAMKKAIGRKWDDTLLEDMSTWLSEDHLLPDDAPGGMVKYRRALVQSFFFKFFMEAKGDNSLSINHKQEGRVSATQPWEDVPADQPSHDHVGRSVMHKSALKQVTGEARYIDDMPMFKDELFLSFVTSKEAHADIVGVDISEAKKAAGFVTYVDRNDVPGSNLVWRDETVFADGEVICVGHIIGAVLADTATHAQRASRLVKVDYKKKFPVIITIEDAIKHKSFHHHEEGDLYINYGDVDKAFNTCDYVLEGQVRTNPQDHFYLETQASIAVPKCEDGEMEVFASTQHTALTQASIASALGIARNKVLVRVKRMGGGFGGKESRSIIVSTPVAVAAHKCGKPVRCMLTRQEDMQMSGTRHAFLSKYKIGFMKDGRILALRQELYNNAGNTPDLSPEVAVKAVFQINNCYTIPNVEVRAHVCKTNIASNTAFRGFGSPQAMFIAETYIDHVASHLGIVTEEVRETNLWSVGDMTHFSQTIETSSVRDCWNACVRKSELEKRRAEIKEFNSKNRWQKRGVACVPTAFGIAYEVFLNQAGALVLIYTDGSVLVSHGGTEMGQGLHTKMIQIASRELGVDQANIHISETSTNCVPNSSATAASLSSDLYGMAVKDACEKLTERLRPIKKANPSWDWEKVVVEAYMRRISLSATGYYRMPDIEYTWDRVRGQVEGRVYNYFTCGAAVSEVEVDCLTGDHRVIQTDIVMDLGRSLNPAVDVGQIEGAFVQGYGMFTMEEPLYSQGGKVWTVGPGAYKIPGFDDIPSKFNVHLLPKTENKRAIYSSKAVGEPPLFLAASVFFAIKSAITEARKESGVIGYFRMDSPASSERIRMSCSDKIVTKINEEPASTKKPWAIRA